MPILTDTHATPHPARPAAAKATATRGDASVRDTVRVLGEIVTQLSERIELLEARLSLEAAR